MIEKRSEDWDHLLEQWYDWACRCSPFISNLDNKESTHFLLSGLEWQTGELALLHFPPGHCWFAEPSEKPMCIWIAPHSKCYLRAYALCCYLKHQYQVSAWNTTSDLVGKTDSVHYRQINISLLCIDLVLRSPRQVLGQGKVLSQIFWSYSIEMNFSLCFAIENEGDSCVCIISVWFFKLFFIFPLLLWAKYLFLLLREPSQSSSIFLMLDVVHEQIMIQFCMT